MRFYLLDDDVNTLQMLANLIEDHDLGTVIKQQTDPSEALREMPALAIDICIIDYLMPKIDGSSVMKQIKGMPGGASIDFIMVSQVEETTMINSSYESGAELVIHKPLNIIAFRQVVKLVAQRREMQDKLRQIRSFLGSADLSQSESGMGSGQRKGQSGDYLGEKYRQRIAYLLTELGMMGEKGTEDIMRICLLMLEKQERSERYFNSVIAAAGERPQTVTQRMRRAIAKGLTTVAHMGIEDFGQEVFHQYAYHLFDAQSIRDEIAMMKGRQPYGGKVNLFQFISALLILTLE